MILVPAIAEASATGVIGDDIGIGYWQEAGAGKTRTGHE